MTHRSTAAALLTLLLLGCGGTPDSPEPPPAEAFGDPQRFKVTRLSLELPPASAVPPQGPAAEHFDPGFPLSLGSGLCFAGRDGDALEFWAITDRGPNGDGPELVRADGTRAPTKVFGAPEFSPLAARLRVVGDRATVVESSPLTSPEGIPLSGLPRPAGPGSTGEVALGEDLSIFDPSPVGVDPEGIALDAEGKLWICEEYGPDVLRIDPRTGDVLTHLRPGEGLPEDVARRIPNRGFEALCVTPSGKLVVGVQSVCVDSKGKRMSPFLRLVEVDPADGSTRTLAYLHDGGAYRKPADAKFGDMCALSDDELLVVEQGKTPDGLRNVIYRVDLRTASDISGLNRADGTALEGAKLSELEDLGVRFVTKTPVLDLRALGWDVEKAEGLAIVDAKTLAVIADHDFGLETRLLEPLDGNDDVEDYTLEDGVLHLEGKPAPEAKLRMLPSGEPTTFWLIELPEPLPLKR